MSSLNYCPLQTIREEAGLQSAKNNDSPSGAIDGENKTFYVGNAPIVDRNYDDSTDGSDVLFYVNGSVVEVESIDPDTGRIDLAEAPAEGATLSVSYAFSNVSDTRVEEMRNEAQGWLNNRIKSYYNLNTLTAQNLPAEFRTFIRLYAGGLLLIRDHGSHADLEDTSKDGYKKLETARDLVKEFIADIMNDADTSTPVAPVVKTDGNIFNRERFDSEGGAEYPATENFMRKD
jgi:hypothetical protein